MFALIIEKSCRCHRIVFNKLAKTYKIVILYHTSINVDFTLNISENYYCYIITIEIINDWAY